MITNIIKEPSKSFEINLVVRDAEGNPTGQRKSLATNDSNKLYDFWMKYQGKPRKKNKNKTKKESLPNARQADQILKELYKTDKGE